MVKIPVNVPTSAEDSDFTCGTASFSDVFFRYLEDGETSSSGSFCNSDDEDEQNSFDLKESKAFWNSQDELLQVLTHFNLLISLDPILIRSKTKTR